MFIIRPSYRGGISSRQSQPARQTRSTDARSMVEKTCSLNARKSSNSRRSITTAGIWAALARSIPFRPGLDPITSEILHCSLSSAISSIRFCSVVPDPLTSTANLRGVVIRVPVVSFPLPLVNFAAALFSLQEIFYFDPASTRRCPKCRCGFKYFTPASVQSAISSAAVNAPLTLTRASCRTIGLAKRVNSTIHP